MAKRSVTIDVEDDEGVAYHLRVTGPITREKVLRMFETMGMADIEQEVPRAHPTTVGGRIQALIDKEYPVGSFTSSDIREKYEDEYNRPIQLSVVSTYLSRFAGRGRVVRQRRGREWSYQVAGGGRAAPARTPGPL